MKRSANPGYPVGYRRPPRRTQFQPGQSGNPKGRPKGSLNLATLLERELRERVVINENGRRRTISKMEAAIKQMVNKAATGDLLALKLLHTLVISAEEQAMNASGRQARSMSEDDQKVLQGILERLGRGLKEISNENPTL